MCVCVCVPRKQLTNQLNVWMWLRFICLLIILIGSQRGGWRRDIISATWLYFERVRAREIVQYVLGDISVGLGWVVLGVVRSSYMKRSPRERVREETNDKSGARAQTQQRQHIEQTNKQKTYVCGTFSYTECKQSHARHFRWLCVFVKKNISYP